MRKVIQISNQISNCEGCKTSTTGACGEHVTYLRWDFKEFCEECVLIPAGVRHFKITNLGGPFPKDIKINGKSFSPSGNEYEPPQFDFDHCTNKPLRHPEIVVCSDTPKQHVRAEWWW